MLFHYMQLCLHIAQANQRKCYLWHNWHTSILYTCMYWCLPDCFFSSSNTSLSCYPTVCIFLCSQLNWKKQHDQLSLWVRWWQLKVTSSKSLMKIWGSYWYFHLYLYFYFHLSLYLYLKTQDDQLSLCALMAVESHKLKLSNQCLRQEQRIDANFILQLFDSAGKLFFSTIQRI